MEQFIVQIKPLTPLWTGDAERKYSTLRETGIIGSLRWWYEALIRGLGGTACDPTNSKCDGKHHCDACELFGCTSWARKFKLEVKKNKGSELAFEFTSIRKLEDIEWFLLYKTLEIISEYGTIGGKFADPKYGVIEIQKNNNNIEKIICKKTDIDVYFKKQKEGIYSPNLLMFIFSNDNKIIKEVIIMKKLFPYLRGEENKGRKYCYKKFKDKDKKMNRFFLYTDDAEQYLGIKHYIDSLDIKYIEGKELLEKLLEELR